MYKTLYVDTKQCRPFIALFSRITYSGKYTRSTTSLWHTAYSCVVTVDVCRSRLTVIYVCPQNELRTQPNGWVPIALPRFSSDGSYYVSLRWSLEQTDGNIWQHLALSLRIGDDIVTSSITPQQATVNNYVGMNEQRFELYVKFALYICIRLCLNNAPD